MGFVMLRKKLQKAWDNCLGCDAVHSTGTVSINVFYGQSPCLFIFFYLLNQSGYLFPVFLPSSLTLNLKGYSFASGFLVTFSEYYHLARIKFVSATWLDLCVMGPSLLLFCCRATSLCLLPVTSQTLRSVPKLNDTQRVTITLHTCSQTCFKYDRGI